MKDTASLSFSIPEEVLEVVNILKQAGFEAYLVGGCVRDLLLGREPEDWDVATDAIPEKILSLFEHSFYENAFGTVGVVFENALDPRHKIVEVTTYRKEGTYSDKRRPDEVSFTRNIAEDLERRDFTINAIAFLPEVENRNLGDVSRGTLIDPFHGKQDLDKKTIRAVGDPKSRLNEDALRIMRAVRIAAVLNFSIEPKTQEAIVQSVGELKNIAIERIRDEFIKIVDSKNPMSGLFLMERLGILGEVMPEFLPAVNMKQNQAHKYSLWEHLLRTLQYAADKGLTLHVKLAALFHDIGKIHTREWSEKKKDWTFHGHDVVGAKITKIILERLKFDKETVSRVTKLVRWHMFFSDTDQITLSAVRRMIRNVEKDNVPDLLALRRADRIGTGVPKESPKRLRKYESMIEEVLRDPISVGMLKINGSDIMEITRSQPGEHVGNILYALLDEVLDDPQKNDLEYLKKRSVELYNLPHDKLKALGAQGRRTQEAKDEDIIKQIREKHSVR